MLNFLTEQLGEVFTIIGLIIAYLSLVLPINKYLQEKSLQERQLQFQNYHKLIGELVGEQ